MRRLAFLLTFALPLVAAPRDPGKVYSLLEKGATLSAGDSAALERRVQSKPADEEARIQLLAYYAAPHPDQDVVAIKAARLRHILYLIEHDPKNGFGLFQVATRVYQWNCRGDELADPAAFPQVAQLWEDQLLKHPKDADVRREAVDALRYCSAERAESLLKQSGDQDGLGRLYGESVLGITGYDYRSNDPNGTDAALRDSPFARQAMEKLQTAAEPNLIAAAAKALLREGAILWADGKLDWDYTPLGTALAQKALPSFRHDFRLKTLPTTLPPRGERPPATITIGGNVLQKKLVAQPPPTYPMNARNAGIQGTVSLAALIAPDGAIADLDVKSGPPELVDSAVAAVSRWRYQPTLLNGKPCFVITQIDVNYTLGR
jgi:TonB family protein